MGLSLGFVCYVKKGKNERGTLWTNLDAFPLAGPVLIVSEEDHLVQ